MTRTRRLIGRSPSWRGGVRWRAAAAARGGIRPQQVAGDDAEVHLVGAVGQPQAAGAGVGGGEREVLAHAATAVQLDGEVDDVAGHLRHRHLDLGDLRLGALDADRVELPGGVQHEQAGLVDGDPGVGEALAVAAEVGDRLAEGDPAGRALAGQLERLLGQADERACSGAPGPGRGGPGRSRRRGPGRRGSRRPAARTPLEGDLAVAERLVVLAERGEHPLDRDARRPRAARATIECWRCRCGLGVGEAHEDADLAVGVAGAGRPPLAAVEHDLVAVEGGGGLHVGGVGAGDARLGHQEGAAHPPVEQRLEPLLLLLGRAVRAAAPPCCRCRGRCS